MTVDIVFGFLPLMIWTYLLVLRRGFWLLRDRDTHTLQPPQSWPTVVAIVPARNEAQVIEQSIENLITQDYPARFQVVLVDDQSDDGTAELARAVQDRNPNAKGRLSIIRATSRPPGWTGKLWAIQQGYQHVAGFDPQFLWFSDADISHSSDNLRQLVSRALGKDLVLVSLMARLNCKTAAEHFLVPAFVFYFGMLYPFGAVNDADDPLAAAAGGCMLVRHDALLRAGGLEAIRHNIIDDCALGRLMKRQGRIWLGLSERAVSLRRYDRLGDIAQMVRRTAYAQLGYSALLLAATLLGLSLMFIAPVITALFAWGSSQLAGWLTWLIMAVMFQPILRFYRLSPLWGLALPLIGVFYAAFTFQSALQHWSGKGGMWKGRAQAGEKA